jgi:F-type H+-transporting ATPase subunit b
MIGATEPIRLIPDFTVFYQLAIFLAVVAILSVFVFRPVLRILDKRRDKTLETEVRAEMLQTDINLINKEYDETISRARKEGCIIQQQVINKAEADAKKIIQAARREEKELSEKSRERISAEKTLLKKDLSKNIDEFSDMIVSKILGKGS